MPESSPARPWVLMPCAMVLMIGACVDSALRPYTPEQKRAALARIDALEATEAAKRARLREESERHFRQAREEEARATAAAAEQQARITEEADRHAARLRDPSWRSAQPGYQGAHWGMSRAEVRKLFPRALGSKAILAMSGPAAGFKEVTTRFYFADDRLTHIVLGFAFKGEVRSEDEAFEVLLAALGKKYGESSGATWELPETTVSLKLDKLEVIDRLTITYASRELADLEPTASDQAGKDL